MKALTSNDGSNGLLRSCYELVTHLLRVWDDYALVTSELRSSFELATHLLQASYAVATSWLRTCYKLATHLCEFTTYHSTNKIQHIKFGSDVVTKTRILKSRLQLYLLVFSAVESRCAFSPQSGRICFCNFIFQWTQCTFRMYLVSVT